jgi:hypothetical protein
VRFDKLGGMEKHLSTEQSTSQEIEILRHHRRARTDTRDHLVYRLQSSHIARYSLLVVQIGTSLNTVSTNRAESRTAKGTGKATLWSRGK